MIKITEHLSIDSSEYELSFSRSSGPGGQNVNKVNTKATLKWDFENSTAITSGVRERFLLKYGNRINNLGQVVIQSDAYRDQTRNADDCREKLSAWLNEVLVPPKKRKPTKPSKSKVEKRLNLKKQQSDKKKNRSWKI